MMKKKILLLPLIFLITICLVNGLTLVDDDDFESYSINMDSNMTLLESESSGEWRCFSAPDEPTCVDALGSPAPSADGYFQIRDDGTGNQIMRMLAVDGSGSNAYIVRLDWNHINVSQLSVAGNYSLQYKMRLIWYEGSNSTCNEWFTGFWDLGSNLYGIGSYDIAAGMGCVSGAGTAENFTRIRPINYNIFTNFQPANAHSNCSVYDGNWHRITQHLVYNTTYDLNEYSTYVDDKLCFRITSGNQK